MNLTKLKLHEKELFSMLEMSVRLNYPEADKVSVEVWDCDGYRKIIRIMLVIGLDKMFCDKMIDLNKFDISNLNDRAKNAFDAMINGAASAGVTVTEYVASFKSNDYV